MNAQLNFLRWGFICAHQLARLSRKIWFLCLVSAGLTLASVVYGEDAPLVLEEITCEGNEKSACSFIIAQTALQAGEMANDEKIKEATLRLKLVGQFQDAEIRLAKGSAPGKAKAIIQVKERSTYAYAINAGAIGARPDKYGFSAVADFTGSDKNFSGHGDSLSLRVRDEHYNLARKSSYYTQNQQVARLEYIRPSFLTPRMYLIAGVGARRYKIYSWEDYTLWADVALGYKLFDYSFVTIGHRIFTNYQSQNTFFQYGWDSQDNADFPTQGSRLLLNFSWQRTYFYRKKDFVFYTGSFLQNFSLKEGHVLSFRVGNFQEKDPAFNAREDEAVSVRYTRIKKRGTGGELGDFKKTSYYIEPGYFTGFYGGGLWGAKLGTNIQTDHGLISLFLMGGAK